MNGKSFVDEWNDFDEKISSEFWDEVEIENFPDELYLFKWHLIGNELVPFTKVCRIPEGIKNYKDEFKTNKYLALH